jgi:hypothetical protein
MPPQILTLKLDGITAGDYLAWGRHRHPPARGCAVPPVHVDTKTLGDTITTTLGCNQPAPLPPANATAPAQPPLTSTQTHPPVTCAAAAIDHPSIVERESATDLERRPPTCLPGHQTIARNPLLDAPAEQPRRRHDRQESEARPAEEPGPARTHPTGSLLASPERTQVKHELALALTDLGGATFALAYHGALNDERLVPRVQRVRDLFTHLSALDHTTHANQPTNEPATPVVAP